MSEPLNLSITDSALDKIRKLFAEEGNPSLMLRVFSSPEESWGFQFEDTSVDGDRMLEFPGVKVLLGSDVIESLRDATIDFSDEGGFNISNVGTLEHSAGCQHMAELPHMPSPEKLKMMRKGLRKQKLPDAASMTHGGHDKIGQFVFEHQTDKVMVRWNLAEGASKQATFAELCFSPEREQDRLELGWMIANMAQLDMEHELEDARNIPHPEYCMREMSRIMGYFGKIEKRWRHWAIAQAGHMLA